jgi:hypothetical protein
MVWLFKKQQLTTGPLAPFFEGVRLRWLLGRALRAMVSVFPMLDAKSLAACHLFESITSLLTRRLVNGATTSTVGNATIQLLNQAVIHRFKNPSINPVVFKTETPETTQDIKIDRKKPNVSWVYLVGIISIEPCNVSF